MDICRAGARLHKRAAAVAIEGAKRAELAAAYEACAGPLYRYLVSLLGSVEEAEDALQEIFLNLLRRLPQGEVRDLRSYLFRAARNEAITRRRASSSRNTHSPLSWIDRAACPEVDRAAEIDLSRALQSLPLEQREVVVLKLSEGFTFQEIGGVLHISPNTAASRYRLGLARLRVLLEGGEKNG